jgi:hypothetical protein
MSELTQIPPRTVHARLRAQGIALRTRGRFNREDRLAIESEILADMYVSAGVVLRSPAADPRSCADGEPGRLIVTFWHDAKVAADSLRLNMQPTVACFCRRATVGCR